ncbi:MAG TPA: hypothetical protein GX707_14915 [Epulopiscium sp.]|nr:hypothetical protein [Candidatus Epulonipiscium sp.]
MEFIKEIINYLQQEDVKIGIISGALGGALLLIMVNLYTKIKTFMFNKIWITIRQTCKRWYRGLIKKQPIGKDISKALCCAKSPRGTVPHHSTVVK